MKAAIISIITILLFGSCSSSRYGYMPKGKRQKNSTKKEVRKWQKHPKQTESISIQQGQLPKSSINKTSVPRIELPKLKQPNQKRSKVRELENESPKVKSENASDTPKQNKKTAHQKQQKTQSSGFWEDLWGDFLAELIGAFILLALSVFFIWLDSIGLGWVVILISIILLVLIIIWIGEVIEDIWDMVFPSY